MLKNVIKGFADRISGLFGKNKEKQEFFENSKICKKTEEIKMETLEEINEETEEETFIYVSVVFRNGGKTYYYRTENESFEIGDKVVVPVGKNMREVTVTITDIEYFKKSEVPYPLEHTKIILRLSDEQFDIDDIDLELFEGNDLIKKALSNFNRSSTHNNAVNVLSAIAWRIKEGGEFAVPVFARVGVYYSGKQAEVLAKSQFEFEICRLMDNSGNSLFTAFTDDDEVLKGQAAPTHYYSIEEFLELASETDDVDGVVINPWDKPFSLSKENIDLILKTVKSLT